MYVHESLSQNHMNKADDEVIIWNSTQDNLPPPTTTLDGHQVFVQEEPRIDQQIRAASRCC